MDSDDDSIPPPPPPPPSSAAATESLEVQSTPTLERLKSGGKVRTSSRKSGRLSGRGRSSSKPTGAVISVDNMENGRRTSYVVKNDEKKPNTRRKKCLIFLVVLLLVGGGVGAALGIILTRDKDANAAENSSGSDLTSGKQDGTVDLFPIAEPTIPDEYDKDDVALDVLRNVLPTKAYAALSNPDRDTSQSDALDFILNDDEFVYDWDGLASSPIDIDARTTFVQRYTAATLYISTDGKDWDNNDGWMGRMNVCTWYGVGCDDDGRVTSLSLSDNNLNGPIPADLSVLGDLHTIEMHKNNLSGEIPSSIFDMNSLKILYLDENELEGKISDSIGQLSKLEKLTLNDNEFSGEIPSEIGDLDNLDMLWLYNNPDIEGNIPVEISNCQKLSK